MPPTIQAFLNKLNANERMALWGAVIVAIASIFGGGWLSLIGAIVVIVVYWLKYSPTSNMTWPAPVQLITLAISGLILLFALLGVLGAIGLSGFASFAFGGMFIVYLIASIAVAIGAVMMALGTWREYQAMPKATPPAPPAPPTAPPAA